MTKTWTPGQIIKLYRTNKAKSTVLRDEEKGIIPPAKREKRGATSVRVWDEELIPEVGKEYGFLKKNYKKKRNPQSVISIYAPKGGVLKSTLSFNLARMFALNNISVLAIGLEVSQRTLTSNLEPVHNYEVESIAEAQKLHTGGLWDVSEGNLSIHDIICTSALPNLHYIPESTDLNLLEQRIKDSPRREYFLKKLLKPVMKNYEVIIFDNSPSWGSLLVQNSLTLATDVIAPFSCELESYRSVTTNIEMINNFKKEMELTWNSFSIVPTKVDQTKLSKEIETQYRVSFPEFVTASTIRFLRGAAEESGMEQLSVIENSNTSTLAEDYYSLAKELWARIN
ncbi:Chromosome partitioning protein ParA [Piscirickettsiaceae bacterium NZ-RLO1]|nr:Chromosome partitioning protein ParA [Piscirickettsiaceae bacterium NZ-RLO1]